MLANLVLRTKDHTNRKTDRKLNKLAYSILSLEWLKMATHSSILAWEVP